MKRILLATVALAAVAAPALAQSVPSKFQAQSWALESRAQYRAQYREDVSRHSTNPVHDVYIGGKYIGSDPDPLIRNSLARESEGALD